MADVARGPEGEQWLRDRLKAGLTDRTARQQGPPGELAGGVSATAARSRSTETPTGGAPGQAAPAEPAVVGGQ
ncbi:hypothetical protein [Streptomyces sp. NPDC054838]